MSKLTVTVVSLASGVRLAIPDVTLENLCFNRIFLVSFTSYVVRSFLIVPEVLVMSPGF